VNIIRVNHNIQALNAWRNSKTSSNKIENALGRLSTGKRIASASDDAAGLSVSEKMRAQTIGLQTATKNAQHAVSLLQTAEGGMGEIQALIGRMRELSVQALNGTYTDTDRVAMNDEFQQLMDEVDKISHTTEFNKMSLLDRNREIFIQATEETTEYSLQQSSVEMEKYDTYEVTSNSRSLATNTGAYSAVFDTVDSLKKFDPSTSLTIPDVNYNESLANLGDTYSDTITFASGSGNEDIVFDFERLAGDQVSIKATHEGVEIGSKTIDINNASTKKADIVFFVDTTGSMGGEISSIKTKINDFVTKLSSDGIDAQYGLVEFSESENLSSVGQLTTATLIQDRINSIDLDSTGHYQGLNAMYKALQPTSIFQQPGGFRSDATKQFILITDEVQDENPATSAWDYNDSTPPSVDLQNRINDFRTHGVDVTVMAGPGGHGNAAVQLEPLAEQTGSKLYNLTDVGSTIATDIADHIETAASNTIMELNSIINDDGDTITFDSVRIKFESDDLKTIGIDAHETAVASLCLDCSPRLSTDAALTVQNFDKTETLTVESHSNQHDQDIHIRYKKDVSGDVEYEIYSDTYNYGTGTISDADLTGGKVTIPLLPDDMSVTFDFNDSVPASGDKNRVRLQLNSDDYIPQSGQYTVERYDNAGTYEYKIKKDGSDIPGATGEWSKGYHLVDGHMIEFDEKIIFDEERFDFAQNVTWPGSNIELNMDTEKVIVNVTQLDPNTYEMKVNSESGVEMASQEISYAELASGRVEVPLEGNDLKVTVITELNATDGFQYHLALQSDNYTAGSDDFYVEKILENGEEKYQLVKDSGGTVSVSEKGDWDTGFIYSNGMEFNYSEVDTGDEMAIDKQFYSPVPSETTLNLGEVKLNCKLTDMPGKQVGYSLMTESGFVIKSGEISQEELDADNAIEFSLEPDDLDLKLEFSPTMTKADIVLKTDDYTPDLGTYTVEKEQFGNKDMYMLHRDINGVKDQVTSGEWEKGFAFTNGQLFVFEETTTEKVYYKKEVSTEANPFSFHVGANLQQEMKVNIENMTPEHLKLKPPPLELLNRALAEHAQRILDEAAKTVSGARSDLGAVQNALDHVINNISNGSENLTAAGSRITDADMAREQISLTKSQVVNQTANTYLMQANKISQEGLQSLFESMKSIGA